MIGYVCTIMSVIVFNQMKQQPAYVLTLESADDTVYELYTAGKAMKQSLEAAASGYETLMTSTEGRYGETVYQKHFRMWMIYLKSFR